MKDWQATLGPERPVGFTRRRRVALTAEQEREVTRAVRAVQAGDGDAVRFLYCRFADDVYSYVRSIVRDDHEAEDVTQHVFAKLLGGLDRYEARAVPFSHWLLRLSHNAAVDHLRTQRSTPVADVRAAHDVADEAEVHLRRLLRIALERMPEDQREVLVLRHMAGLAPSEIAARMGRTVASVNSLHHRGRRTLRATLRDLGAEPVTLRRAA